MCTAVTRLLFPFMAKKKKRKKKKLPAVWLRKKKKKERESEVIMLHSVILDFISCQPFGKWSFLRPLQRLGLWATCALTATLARRKRHTRADTVAHTRFDVIFKTSAEFLLAH